MTLQKFAYHINRRTFLHFLPFNFLLVINNNLQSFWAYLYVILSDSEESVCLFFVSFWTQWRIWLSYAHPTPLYSPAQAGDIFYRYITPCPWLKIVLTTPPAIGGGNYSSHKKALIFNTTKKRSRTAPLKHTVNNYLSSLPTLFIIAVLCSSKECA